MEGIYLSPALLRRLLMGQPVQASGPSAGSSGCRVPICSLFRACCFPIAGPPCQAFSFLLPSLFKRRGTWRCLLPWSSLSLCLALGKDGGAQNPTVGSFVLILSAGRAMSVGRASIWCQERGLEHCVSVGSPVIPDSVFWWGWGWGVVQNPLLLHISCLLWNPPS